MQLHAEAGNLVPLWQQTGRTRRAAQRARASYLLI
jgi:hypothetical protein